MKSSYFVRGLLLGILVLALVRTASCQESVCGRLENHYGPFDYRTAHKDRKNMVEHAHFTPKVENLIGGQTSMYPGGDMAYTLHVFPNHPRALMALIRLAEKEKTNKAREMAYSVDCYFERAERFSPDDAMAKSIHGVYLIKKGKFREAKEKLEEALSLAGENANIFYNLGLAYFELNDYDKALESAHRAYALGFPLPGLRDKLMRSGKWKEAASNPRPKTESDQ